MGNFRFIWTRSFCKQTIFSSVILALQLGDSSELILYTKKFNQTQAIRAKT
jgi:hypothetical protein